MLQLERILQQIAALPQAKPAFGDLLTDANTEVDMWSAECDRLRSVLREACGIIDGVATICGITDPAHALPLLNADEQARLYALLKGESE